VACHPLDESESQAHSPDESTHSAQGHLPTS
jgi:hypothetical protein